MYLSTYFDININPISAVKFSQNQSNILLWASNLSEDLSYIGFAYRLSYFQFVPFGERERERDAQSCE